MRFYFLKYLSLYFASIVLFCFIGKSMKFISDQILRRDVQIEEKDCQIIGLLDFTFSILLLVQEKRMGCSGGVEDTYCFHKDFTKGSEVLI